MDGLLNLGIMSFAGLLNRSEAGLGKLGLNGENPTCNKDIYVSISFMASCHGSFYKFYTCLCLSIALMIIRL